MVLSKSVTWSTHHHNLSAELFHHPKWKPCTHYHSASSPRHKLLANMNLSLWICLFWRIIKYVAFCVWLLSVSMFPSFIHVVVCINISFLFYSGVCHCTQTVFCLIIHALMDSWDVSTFWLLWTEPLWTFEHKFLLEPLLSVFSRPNSCRNIVIR